jgi:formate transporter
VGAAWLMWLADGLSVGNGDVRATAIEIARAKLALDPLPAFARGVLCNALVCLAAWLCMAAHDVASKAVAIMLPVTAFVALGFEHSVANMYLLPVAWLHGATEVTLAGVLGNLVPVTLGNLVGGTLLVALVYWICYLRSND